MRGRVVFLFFLFSLLSRIFAQNFYDGFEQKERFNSFEAKGALLAFGGTVLCDATLLCFNRFVTRAEYAQASAEDINENLHSAWVWDQDTFQVNQLGHPYQGSFYFASARAAGLPFELAALYAAAGSVIWEYFAENETPSINDLICTTLGGAGFGEMLHRIFVEIAPKCLPVACLISPMDALIGSILKNEQTERGKIVGLSTFFGAGMGASQVCFDGSRNKSQNILLPGAFGGFDVSYGDAFFAPAWLPYSAFDLKIDLEGTDGFFNVAILSEAILSRFKTFFGRKSKVFVGLAMQLDILWSNIFAHYDNGIGILFKTRTDFDNKLRINFSASANATLLGASDYWRLYSGDIKWPDDGVERRSYDFGLGAMAKASLEISQKALGVFQFQILSAFMQTIPEAVPPRGSEGRSFSNFFLASYEHDIKSGFSLGVMYFGQLKAAWLENDANVLTHAFNIRIFSRFAIWQ